jgi:hypothetical protein
MNRAVSLAVVVVLTAVTGFAGYGWAPGWPGCPTGCAPIAESEICGGGDGEGCSCSRVHRQCGSGVDGGAVMCEIVSC